jgi:hypothetical protein
MRYEPGEHGVRAWCLGGVGTGGLNRAPFRPPHPPPPWPLSTHTPHTTHRTPSFLSLQESKAADLEFAVETLRGELGTAQAALASAREGFEALRRNAAQVCAWRHGWPSSVPHAPTPQANS